MKKAWHVPVERESESNFDRDEDPMAFDKRPLEILGLPRGLTDKVYQKASTIGELIRWLRSGGRLCDISGISGERAGKVADAIADFRKSYPNPPVKRAS
jgi:hypothetical protein